MALLRKFLSRPRPISSEPGLDRDTGRSRKEMKGGRFPMVARAVCRYLLDGVRILGQAHTVNGEWRCSLNRRRFVPHGIQTPIAVRRDQPSSSCKQFGALPVRFHRKRKAFLPCRVR